MIQLIEINVGEELTCQRADRQTDAGESAGVQDMIHEPECVAIADGLPDNAPQNIMVDAREIMMDIAFKKIEPAVSALDLLRISLRKRHGPMCASVHPASKALIYHFAVKERVNDPDQRVMDHSVTKGRRVDCAFFRLVDLENPPGFWLPGLP